MIDRPSRDKLALAIRRYAAGLISNDELDCLEVDEFDRGVAEVKKMSWQLYSDNEQHYAKGEHYLAKDTKREIAKWIVFLHSDHEYVWPHYSFTQIVKWHAFNLTLGWWKGPKERKWNELLEGGDPSAWPFFSKTELEDAIKHPRLLSGSGQRSDRIDSLH